MLFPPLANTTKGRLHFTGLGPQHLWTLTTNSGRKINLWEVFVDSITIYDMEYSHLSVGREHFVFKRCVKTEISEPLCTHEIKKFINGEPITQQKLQQMIDWIVTICTESLNWKHVRLYCVDGEFSIMSKAYHESLKKIGQSNERGLYTNKDGFCRVGQRKKKCHFCTSSQCIYAKKITELNCRNIRRDRIACGKFNQKFAKKQLRFYEKGKITGTVGDCENLRGFEIF